MAKTNKTLFDELADVPGITRGIRSLISENEKYGKSAEQIAQRIQQSQKQVVEDLKVHKEQIIALNVAQKARQIQLQQEAAEVAKLAKAHKDQQALLSRNKALFDANAASVDQLKARVADLKSEYNALGNAQAQDVQRKREIETETRVLNRLLNEQVAATKRATQAAQAAAGSYDKLQQETKELWAELRKMPNAIDATTGALNKHNSTAVAYYHQIQKNERALKTFDEGMGRSQRNVGNYRSALEGFVSGGMTGLAGSLGIAGAAILALSSNINAFLNAASQYERIEAGLKAVTQDSNDLRVAQEFLATTADQYGLSLINLTKSYTAFKANTNDTFLRGREAERIFLSVAKASAALNLSIDDSSGVLRAFGQMLSKGTVQSEELKGQVGERLYNAFGMAAKAMGVTTQQLNKMLEQGEVMATDLLPKLATELEKTWGSKAANNVTTLAGATERLTNQTGALVETLNKELGATNFFASVKNEIADTLRVMNRAIKSRDWTVFFGAFSDLLTKTPLMLSGAGLLMQPARMLASSRVETQKKMETELAQFKTLNHSNRRDLMNWTNPAGMEAELSKKELEYRRKLYHEMRLANFDLVNKETEQLINDRRAIKEKYAQKLEQFEGEGREKQKKILEAQAKKQGADEQKMYQDMLQIYETKNAEFLEKKRQTKLKQQQAAADRELRERLQTNRANASTEVNKLRSQNEAGDLSEADLINQEYLARTNAAVEQIKMLNKSGKQNTAEWKSEYAAAQKEITDAAADWSEKRNKLTEKEFKLAVSEAKDALKNIEDFQNDTFTSRIQKLDEEYDKSEQVIAKNYAKGLITRDIMEEQMHDNRIMYLKDFARAVDDTYRLQKITIESTYDAEINRLQDLLKQGGLNSKQRADAESRIAEIKADKQKKLDDAQAKRDKDNSEARKQQSDEETKKDIDNAKKVKEEKQELEALYFRIASAGVNGYFDYVNQQRANDLANEQKQRDKELELAGDNDEAKRAIQARYAEREKQYARQQAIRDKAQALFNIAIDTAQAVVAAAEKPVLIPAIIALGAVQAALVSARPIPAFKEGKGLEGLDRYEGPALVGEAGRELWFNRNGVQMVDQPSVVNVGKDDVILPNSMTEKIMRDNRTFETSGILTRLALNEAAFQRIERYQSARNQSVSINYAAMGKALADELEKRPQFQLNIDENGFTRSIIHKTTKTIQRNKTRYLGYRMVGKS